MEKMVLDPTLQQVLDACYELLEAADLQPSGPALILYNQALAKFQQAHDLVAADPVAAREVRLGLATAYSLRGHQQRYARNHPAAIADLSQALQLSLAKAEDYYYRAMSYLALGNTQAARLDLIDYLKRGESELLREAARNQLATLVPGKEDPKASASHWRNEGMRLNSEASDALHPRNAAPPDWRKAVAIYNRAITAFNQALDASKTDNLSKYGLLTALSHQAEGYLQDGEYDLALENYNRAYELQANPDYIFEKGKILWQSGHHALARASFETYLTQGKNPTLLEQARQFLAVKQVKR